MNSVPTRITAAAVALAAVFVAAPAASASGTTAASCGYSGDTVFAPWGDQRRYTLTPDGGFENGADGWALGGGTAVTEGNETFQVGAASDHQSLALPAGSSATSPAICVSRRDDIFRLFVRTDGGPEARLQVDVLYTDAAGNENTVWSGELNGGDAWAPTRKLNLFVQARGTRNVSLRFTPVGAGSWQIDDLYLDPRLRQ
jgi:hypothetical protein